MAQSACPHRQYMDDPAIKWREGKPDYTKINKAYLEGKTKNHKEGSLEKIVEDLVKTWEMEASHKIQLEDWQTIDRDSFTLRANHQRTFTAKEAIEVGSYNALMQNQPLYNSNKHTFESSHELFRSAFSEGFAWELLEVFSGGSKEIRTYVICDAGAMLNHQLSIAEAMGWNPVGATSSQGSVLLAALANWTGPYKDKAPTGERLEMYGMAVAEVDEKLKIKSIECYFDPNQILMKLEGKDN